MATPEPFVSPAAFVSAAGDDLCPDYANTRSWRGSKSGTRRWCSMTTCGNRAKARRHYLRRKQR